jgi:hypothetical protein
VPAEEYDDEDDLQGALDGQDEQSVDQLDPAAVGPPGHDRGDGVAEEADDDRPAEERERGECREGANSTGQRNTGWWEGFRQ